MKIEPIKNPIRAFAIFTVAVISVYIMWMGYRVNETLSGPGWCGKALGAERVAAESNVDVAASCVGLLTIQLQSVATNSLIYAGSLCLCLVALIVIVVAQGKLSINAGKGGVSANVGKDVGQAAEQVAAAAADEADAIKDAQ